MSVRHQARAYVERLFEKLRERAGSGEFNIYCVYSPVYVQRENLPANQIDVEDFELVDVKVNMQDQESVKKTLDRITREALEMEVKGFYLLSLVLDSGGEYIFSSENPIIEELKKDIEERIERLKEE
ncbi:MAG: hypothetical protein NZM36_00330 [Aquificaceae bacterium]|nr:hypothetical protein [Aquificaceae bacterium]MDW8095984.1 hypothetical protein [Aquificaceae bacterium]